MNKLFVGILMASVLIGILAVIPENVIAETWSIETVDSTGDVGELTSMALDSNDYPHISYSDITKGYLKYAKWTGREWSIETVNSAGYVDKFTSIALDSKGYPHISYSDVINEDLKYAKWTGSAWSIEAVDSDGDVGGSSIALDSNDYPHISYVDRTNDYLKYAKLMPKVPTPPRNLKATAGNSYVYLSWDAPSDDGGTPVMRYKVYRGTTSKGENTLLTTVGNVLTYTDKNVTNNQTYYYDVSAVNSVGEGMRKSNGVSATPEKKYEWGLIIALIAAAAGIAGVIINYLISRKRKYGSISATSSEGAERST